MGLSRIDLLPIDIEELIERDFGGIVGDLDRFAVLRFLRSDQIIRWIRFGPAAVAHAVSYHTGRPIERRLDAPETAPGENRRFSALGGRTFPVDECTKPSAASATKARPKDFMSALDS